MSTGDVDHAWALWTTAAEKTLLALACPDITPDSLPAGATLLLAPPHLPRGRGTDQLLLEVRLCPKQRRDTGGPLTYPVARMQAARAPSGTSSVGWNDGRKARARCGAGYSRRVWRSARYAILELDGAHNRLALLASLHRLRTTLAGTVRATL